MQAPPGTAALSPPTSSLLPSTSALVRRADARDLQCRGTLAEDLVALAEYLGTRAACRCKRPPVPRHGCRGPRRSCRSTRHECRVHSRPRFGHAALLHSTAELVPRTSGRSPRSSGRNCCAFLSDAQPGAGFGGELPKMLATFPWRSFFCFSLSAYVGMWSLGLSGRG
jgi:hypothetical protein